MTAEMRALAFGLFAFAAFSLAACPDDAEQVDDDATGGGGGAPPTYETSACGSCVLAACAADRDDCAADPGCAAHLDCMLDCPLAEQNIDPNCLAACPAPETSTGIAAMDALRACREQASCTTECGGGSGGGHPILDQDCPPSTLTDTCTKCEAEHCCETPCDADCQALFDCTEACPDYPCIDQCFVDNPEGLTSTGKWQVCLLAHCRGDDCPWIPTDPCMDCTMGNCAELFADCFVNTDCYLLFQCSGRCDDGDEACEDACDAQHPEGAVLWGAVLFCAAEKCAGAACPPAPI
jgi:hypothetical protein